jgi:hypothetical protein
MQMSMEDLLNAMMSGQGSSADQAADDPMAGLLGGLLGGGQGESGGIGGLLGGLLGGSQQPAAPSPTGDSGGLLGMVLGSGMLDPIINGLAEKIGLPPETAQAVVAFVINKLLSGGISGGGGDRAGDSAAGAAESPDLDRLLTQMRTGSVDAGTVASTGMAQELAEETGLDQETAEASLQEVFNMLGRGMSGAPTQDAPSRPDRDEAPPKPDLSGIGDLLDTF